MRKFLKVFALVLCLCMALSLIACGSKPVGGEGQSTADPTEKTWPVPTTVDDGPNENQCAGDPTIEETDYPTEPSVPETTEEEGIIEETIPTDTQPEEPSPEAEEEPGDIHIPLDDVEN